MVLAAAEPAAAGPDADLAWHQDGAALAAVLAFAAGAGADAVARGRRPYRRRGGSVCPLHGEHPATGEDLTLGCGVCRNAHTF